MQVLSRATAASLRDLHAGVLLLKCLLDSDHWRRRRLIVRLLSLKLICDLGVYTETAGECCAGRGKLHTVIILEVVTVFVIVSHRNSLVGGGGALDAHYPYLSLDDEVGSTFYCLIFTCNGPKHDGRPGLPDPISL